LRVELPPGTLELIVLRTLTRTTESNREAKYYAITRAARRALEAAIDRRQRSAGLVNRLLTNEGD